MFDSRTSLQIPRDMTLSEHFVQRQSLLAEKTSDLVTRLKSADVRATPDLLLEGIETVGACSTYSLAGRTCQQSARNLKAILKKAVRFEDSEGLRGAIKTAIARVDSSAERVALTVAKIRDRLPTSMPASTEAQAALFRDRMQYELGVAGLNLLFGEDVSDRYSASTAEWDIALPLLNKVEQPFELLLDRLAEFDKALYRNVPFIADVAQTTLLIEMRALMPADASLPWWLSGTIELVSLARTLRDRWPVLANIYQEAGEGPAFVYDVVQHLDGDGHDRREPSRQERGSFIYEWILPKTGAEGDECRLELVAPPPQSGRRTIKLRLAGRQANTRRAMTADSRHRQDRSVPEHAWIAGRMMFLNGLMLRWTVHEGKVEAQLRSDVPPLPQTGDLLLVDCLTNQLLRPAS